MMFKIGDKVRRVVNGSLMMPIGYVGKVSEIQEYSEYTQLIKFKNDQLVYNSVNFELVKE